MQYDNDEIIKKIICNIRKYRISQKKTQKDLANISNYSYSYIKKIESIHYCKDISVKTLNNIAKALNIEIKSLFE